MYLKKAKICENIVANCRRSGDFARIFPLGNDQELPAHQEVGLEMLTPRHYQQPESPMTPDRSKVVKDYFSQPVLVGPEGGNRGVGVRRYSEQEMREANQERRAVKAQADWERLQAARDAKKLREQKDLLRQTDEDAARISRWQKGGVTPSAEAQKFADDVRRRKEEYDVEKATRVGGAAEHSTGLPESFEELDPDETFQSAEADGSFVEASYSAVKTEKEEKPLLPAGNDERQTTLARDAPTEEPKRPLEKSQQQREEETEAEKRLEQLQREEATKLEGEAKKRTEAAQREEQRLERERVEVLEFQQLERQREKDAEEKSRRAKLQQEEKLRQEAKLQLEEQRRLELQLQQQEEQREQREEQQRRQEEQQEEQRQRQREERQKQEQQLLQTTAQTVEEAPVTLAAAERAEQAPPNPPGDVIPPAKKKRAKRTTAAAAATQPPGGKVRGTLRPMKREEILKWACLSYNLALFQPEWLTSWTLPSLPRVCRRVLVSTRVGALRRI